jgi:ribosomal protein L7/L12
MDDLLKLIDTLDDVEVVAVIRRVALRYNSIGMSDPLNAIARRIMETAVITFEPKEIVLMETGNRIAAIREVRDRLCLGLMEAKEAVDAYFRGKNG